MDSIDCYEAYDAQAFQSVHINRVTKKTIKVVDAPCGCGTFRETTKVNYHLNKLGIPACQRCVT